MVSDRSPRLDLVFHALAHPARRAIIRQLSEGERNLSELAAPLEMTFPAATKHVRVLERAKLVRRRVAGRQHFCRLEAAPLKEATQWTESFRKHWEARFEALDSLLEEMKSEERARPRRP
jgi:DNA-binding transcriptional ArsR family regulator